MPACQKYERSLHRYIVGALPPWSRASIARHLDLCPDCRRLAESHHHLTFLLEAQPLSDPPTGLWNGVLNQIAEEKPGARRIPSAPWDWRPSVAVATAGLTMGVLMGHFLGSPAASEPASNFASISTAPSPVVTFAQHHSRMDALDPLADHVSLAAYATTASRSTEQWVGRPETP